MRAGRLQLFWGFAAALVLCASVARADDPPATAGPSPTVQGRWMVFDSVAAPGVSARRVVVVLPESYEAEPGRRFATLYVHDGERVGCDGYGLVDALDALSRTGAVEPHVIVAIDGTAERTAEYTLSAGGARSLRSGRRAQGARRAPDERYVDYVVDTVMPLVAAHVRVDGARSRTAVAGFSYGALAALHCAWRYPERFGRVIAFSPSLWWAGRRMVDALDASPAVRPERLWLDVGTFEGRPADAVPYMVADARSLAERLVRGGMSLGRDLGYHEVPLVPHVWTAVRARASGALRFALGSADFSAGQPSAIRLIAFRPVLASSRDRSGVTLEVDLGDVQLTWPAARATFRVLEPAVVRVDADGSLRPLAGRRGSTDIEASVGALQSRTRVRAGH